MKTSLRVLALFMSLLMLVSVFASCTSKDPEETKAPDKEQNETSKETPKATDDEGNSESATDKPEHVHTEVTDPAKEPTCSETGLTEGKHCSECNEILVSQKTVDKKPHTEATIPAKDSTCKETGLTEGKYCSVCNKTITKQEIVPVKPHTEATIPAKDSTCKETGLTEGKYCSVCNETITKQEIVPVKPHTEVIDPAVPATFDSTGLTEGSHCSVCGDIIVAQVETPKLIPQEFSITYMNLNGATAPTLNSYKENEGVALLPTVSASGYRFLGWFTSSNGGEQISMIEKGSQKDYVLYAHWDVITYTVQYINGEGHGNVTGYNVEDGIIVLKNPSVAKKGYTFKGWFTAEIGGEKVTFIDASKAENIVLYAQWTPVRYNINYYEGTGHNNPTSYTIENSTIRLNKPVEPTGYTFAGWFTDKGEKIEYIYTDSCIEYNLTAKYNAIKYKITFIDAPKHSNPLEYTIEDQIILTAPEWSGLDFIEWRNSSNVVCNKVNKGTTGDLTFTAKWQSKENKVFPATENRNFMVTYDGKNYYVIYELGTISHVVIDERGTNTFYKSNGEDLELTLSSTATVEKSVSESIATTISKSVSKSNEWSQAKDWQKSIGITTDVSASLEVSAYKTIKAKIEASLGTSTETQWGISTVEGASIESGESTEDSSTSTIAYKEEITNTIEEKRTISATMPEGYYSYVHASDIKVYAIVTYDATEEKYYLNTFSYLDNMHAAVLYYPENPTMCESEANVLNYEIPTQKIEDYFASSLYTIKYNANGGQGTMPDSIFNIEMAQNLYPNAFTKTGYTFAGWELKNGNSTTTLSDKQTVSKLANANESITLYATWTANKYNVTFDANGGSVSPKNKTVTYNSTYGTLPTPTKTGHTGVWTLNGNEVTSKTSVTTARDHTLTARWTVNKYTITFVTNGGSTVNTLTYNYAATTTAPTNPTRAGYDFTGWTFNDASFKFGNSMPAQNIVATANWKFKEVVYEDRTYKNINSNCHTDNPYDCIDISDLQVFFNDNYVLNFHIEIGISEDEKGYQYFWFWNENETYKYWQSPGIEHGGTDLNTNMGDYEFDFSASGSTCTPKVILRYWQEGSRGDDWNVHYVKVTITVSEKN